ncbi:MAG: photosynthetic complex assembly protein 2 [Phyllobacteriaceae bacterium]|nr:photosynthetic complex assembly protein 2 [Phyllobacteriaceae bacterium]MBA91081.1 photosynthetic complex assembly protein 2 [Phyllobacteriaceae bacterium]
MDATHPLSVMMIAAVVWWLSTGLVLIAVRRASRGDRQGWAVMAGMTLAGLAGVALLAFGRDQLTPLGSYAGFFGALLVWAWHEAAFLTGLLTGPSKDECPEGLTGLARFRAAFLAVRDHEIAILVTAAILWLGLIGGQNHFGLATFLLLWGMRISAKFVIFLGAPNAVSELMPARIAHLKSYFNTDGITPLFPLVIAAAAGLLIVLCVGASQAQAPHSTVGHLLLATFMALAILEHFILVLPVSDAALWRWAAPKDTIAAVAASAEAETTRAVKPAPDRRIGAALHANSKGRN